MKIAKSKLYPFSAQKYAHDIEFRRNRVKNELYDAQMDRNFDAALLDMMEELADQLTDLLSAILGTCRDGRIAYLTGQQIGLAKETVIWAAEQRAATQERKQMTTL